MASTVPSVDELELSSVVVAALSVASVGIGVSVPTVGEAGSSELVPAELPFDIDGVAEESSTVVLLDAESLSVDGSLGGLDSAGSNATSEVSRASTVVTAGLNTSVTLLELGLEKFPVLALLENILKLFCGVFGPPCGVDEFEQLDDHWGLIMLLSEL